MKRICILLLSLLVLLALAGCGDDTVAVMERGPYSVAVNGQQLTVNPVKGTITAENGDVYTYVIDSSEVTFTYPNGQTYLWDYSSGIGYGSLVDQTEGGRYLGSMALESALEQELEPYQSESKDPANPIFAFLCFIIGGVNLAFPYAGWYLSHGWRFRDAEPSDAALVMARISGGIAVVIGIVFLFI